MRFLLGLEFNPFLFSEWAITPKSIIFVILGLVPRISWMLRDRAGDRDETSASCISFQNIGRGEPKNNTGGEAPRAEIKHLRR